MNGEPNTPHLQLRDIWHRYAAGHGKANAGSGGWTLRQIDLTLQRGELVGLLGPSGCGKTTLLRAVAGLEPVSQGQIHLAGQVVSSCLDSPSSDKSR
jgi:iron(III) transport system ATP-binding protein